jgi:uncharacterized protein (TIGR02246 family)
VTAGNVEVVERVFSSWNDGDPDRFMAPYAEDAVLETPPNFPEGGVVTGFDSIKDFFVTLREGWESGSSVEVKEIRALDDDRVLSDFTWSGTGEASGVEAHLDTLVVFTLRDGKVVRAQFFFDRAEGLRVAGLAG